MIVVSHFLFLLVLLFGNVKHTTLAEKRVLTSSFVEHQQQADKDLSKTVAATTSASETKESSLARNEDHDRQRFDSTMVLLEKHKTLVCICAPCGRSSFLSWLYEIENGTALSNLYGEKLWVDDFETPEWVWKGTEVTRIHSHEQASQAFNDPEIAKFAVIRNPKQRIISVWQTKLACDIKYVKYAHQARHAILKNLLMGAKVHPNEWQFYVHFPKKRGKPMCVNFANYLTLLERLQMAEQDRENSEKRENRADTEHTSGPHDTNPFLRRQSDDCFGSGRQPSQWSGIIDIASADVSKIAERMGDSNLAKKFPHPSIVGSALTTSSAVVTDGESEGLEPKKEVANEVVSVAGREAAGRETRKDAGKERGRTSSSAVHSSRSGSSGGSSFSGSEERRRRVRAVESGEQRVNSEGKGFGFGLTPDQEEILEVLAQRDMDLLAPYLDEL